MSILYADSNKGGARELFNKRKIYRSDVGQSLEGYKNLVNFNFGEKFLYGRVNKLFVPIELNTSSLSTRNFKSTKDLSAVNFVVDAFEGLARQFNKCAMNGKIAADDTYLSGLKVYNARTDTTALYGKHLLAYSTSIVGALRNQNIRVRNFDEFILELEQMINAQGHTFPFTKPAFVKSRFCPINCSGLAVEIADLDPANDEDKVNEFIDSKNWQFYVDTCQAYGFMVDRFVPWRLVADIGSSPMLEYAAKYNFNTTNQILNLGYTLVSTQYFTNFKFHLLNIYNKAKLDSFLEVEECAGDSITRRIVPQTYSTARFTDLYSDSYFLNLYFKMRFMEEESVFEDFQKELLINDCLELYDARGIGASLEAFERILNKPFDYRGSVSYTKAYLETKAAEGS